MSTIMRILRRLRRAGARTATFALVLIGLAPAAGAEPAGQGSIGERIRRLRSAIHEQGLDVTADLPAVGRDEAVPAQWGNWGNWNNWAKWADWNNWNNWANWGNWGNWGNY